MWTQLTVTYKAATNMATLYVNGVATATGFTGAFQLGDARTSGTAHGAYYSGEIADVHTWNVVQPPAQPQTTGSDYIPTTPTRIVDTRSGQGGTSGPIANHTAFATQITGANGIPATNVTAVAVSITATAGSGLGWLNAYPDAQGRSGAFAGVYATLIEDFPRGRVALA